MPQDQQSGAAAAEWDLATGQKVAEQLGATPLIHTSNECMLSGKRIVIKCAKPETDSVRSDIANARTLVPRLWYISAARRELGLDDAENREHLHPFLGEVNLCRLTSFRRSLCFRSCTIE